MSAFLFCFTAWAAIALSMERHREDALGHAGTTLRLRCAGWLLLLLSFWMAAHSVSGIPASLGVTAWTVALSVAAVAVTAAVTWLPHHTPAMAGLALVAGLLAWTWGW